jgi:predicted ATPase
MNEIKIIGYKSIRNATVALRPINILIGGNGSGKSNFLSFFEFLHHLYEQKLQNYVAMNGYIDRLLHQSEQSSTKIIAKLSFNEDKNAYGFGIEKSDDSFIFTKETLFYEKRGWDISENGKEALAKTSDVFRAKYIRNYLEGLKKYHFHDTGRNSPFNKASHVENDVYFLYEKGENLAAFLWMIRQNYPKVYRRLVKNIQGVAPYFSDFFLEPNETGYIKLQWKDQYSSMVYGASNLSDGTIRYIALATLFMQPKLPNTIIIDEPELGLHPFAIAELASLIQSVTNSGVQVIVATQSADLISYFEPEDIITVDQKEGASEFNRLDSNDLKVWLEDFSLGNLWQRSIIKNGQPV